MATKNNNSAGQVEALLNARNVVIVGASDRPGSWSPRSWRNLQRFNYPGKVFPMNPSRETIWDTRCYATFDELPEKPDHLLVMVPARFVCQTLRDGKAAGARSATVITAGFSEASDAGSRCPVPTASAISTALRGLSPCRMTGRSAARQDPSPSSASRVGW
jgi:acyl-CoA synthetase (NDP forming)